MVDLWVMAVALACGAVIYLICGIPFGVVVTRLMSKKDVRSVGSGNIGSTNVAREFGKLAAALTFVGDFGKGFVSIWLARCIIHAALPSVEWSALVATPDQSGLMAWMFLMCILGHVFSPYLHFRGGKGIAVGVGSLYAIWWVPASLLLGLFMLLVAATKKVSIGSLAAAAGVLPAFILLDYGPASFIPAALASAIVLWAHRSNIKRLLAGNESRFSFKKRDEPDERSK